MAADVNGDIHPTSVSIGGATGATGPIGLTQTVTVPSAPTSSFVYLETSGGVGRALNHASAVSAGVP